MPVGFQRSQLISMANKRTENRAQTLDQNAEFAMALQEVALDRRWWWRRKIKTFSIVSGRSVYEFTGTGSLAIDDFQQAERDGLVLMDTASTFLYPDPVFDFKRQQIIKAFQSTQPAGSPSTYFVIGAPGQLVLDPIPNRDYQAALAYWSIPVYADGGTPGEEEAIPSIPSYFHPILLKKLELHFLAFSLGEDSTKYRAAQAEYVELKDNATLYGNFAEGEVKSFATADSQDSIRSS